MNARDLAERSFGEWLVRVAAAAHGLNAANPSAPSSVQSLNAVDRMAFSAPERSAADGPAPGTPRMELPLTEVRRLLAEIRERERGG